MSLGKRGNESNISNKHPFFICVTTKDSPSSLIQSSSSNISDSICLICPYTGTILNGTTSNNRPFLRIGSDTPIHSLSQINIYNNATKCPSYAAAKSSSCQHQFFVALGGKSSKDTFVYLLQSHQPSPKWNCKIPEITTSSPICTSPCGNYIIMGTSTGHCYCWSTFNNGDLLRIWGAHYRAIRSIIFSDCGSYVITGGDDGIVNCWSLMDIVCQDDDDGHLLSFTKSKAGSSRSSSSSSSSSIRPIRTWADHHLAITHLYALPSSRVISSSLDRYIMILELFSSKTLARIELPTAVHCITTDELAHRLYCGGSDGTIYCIDLDNYAIAMTAESATIVRSKKDSIMGVRGTNDSDGFLSVSGAKLGETIFGMSGTELDGAVSGGVGSGGGDDAKANTSTKSLESTYISELLGHRKAVKCLALVEDHTASGSNEPLLVSGGEDGSIRIWDVQARCCIRVLNPWSPLSFENQMNMNPSSKKDDTSVPQKDCACSTITVIPRHCIDGDYDNASSMFAGSGGGGGVGGRGRGSTKLDSIAHLIQPLQRFQKNEMKRGANDDVDMINVINLLPGKDIATLKRLQDFGEVEYNQCASSSSKKSKVDDDTNDDIDMSNDVTPPKQTLSSPPTAKNSTKDSDLHFNNKEQASTHNDTKQDNKSADEIARLRKELEEAQNTILRWKKVNNKLLEKLKKSK